MASLENIYDGYRKVGFEYKVIKGHHLIGMRGNLDTFHDGLIDVHRHTADGKEAADIAKFIVEALNKELGIQP